MHTLSDATRWLKCPTPVSDAPPNDTSTVAVKGAAAHAAYMVGQRVLLTGVGGAKEVGMVVRSETGRTSFGVWVFSPTKGYASDYAPASVEPLPNNQL